jgi:hypothetical protein
MNKLLLPFFIAGTIAMMVVMNKTGKPLKTPATPQGILNLEFAYSRTHVNTVLTAWQSGTAATVIPAAKTNTRWDFVFIFFYAGLLYLLCNRLSRIYKTGSGFEKAGRWLAYAAIVAGLLDVVENACMFIAMNGHVQHALAMATTICAATKFTLVIIALLYCLLSLPLAAYAKIRK